MSNVRNIKGVKPAASEPHPIQLMAVESLPDGVAILDRSGCFAYLNRAHVTMFGFIDIGELIGQSWRLLYGPEEIQNFEQEYLPALERDGHWYGETLARRQDGSSFDVDVKLTKIGGDAISCIARDISHRKRSEQVSSVHSHMVGATKAPMSFVDTHYIFREVNQAYLDMAGKERSDLIGRHVTELVGESHFLSVGKPDLDRCFSGEPTNAQRWVDYLTKGPRYVDVHFDASPMINAKDAHGRFTFMNEYQANVLGVSVREVVGKTTAQVTTATHGAYVDGLEQQVLRSGRALPFFEEALSGHDGVRRTCLTTLVPLPESGSGRRVATISLDITSRKEGEREREELIQELETRNAELERFSYTVSHDLKSPLITIRGFMGLLEQDIVAGDRERVSKDIEKIQEAAQTMQRLLRDLLNLSRIGRVVGAMEDVSLKEIVGEAMDRVSGLLSAFRLDVNVSDSLPIVRGDRTRLVEVIQNLLENVIKFRGQQTHPRVDINCRIDGDEVVCYVRDNGVGIDPRYHEKVFGLFERLDQEVEGTGIGLALVRRIIEVHGGKIWVESEGEGKGSTFCFMLPLALAEVHPE